ncbi:MAG: hypothetical protein H0Z33_14120 [Bacillaceae bacterium]|nr:hypothetical protein [Bacillaceae bacterium]
MKQDPKRTSSNVEKRVEEHTEQPEVTKEKAPGYGNKKLDGPNRPST